MARWERWENGEVARWEVPGFVQELGMQQGEPKDFIFLFLMLIKRKNRWV